MIGRGARALGMDKLLDEMLSEKSRGAGEEKKNEKRTSRSEIRIGKV